MAHAYFNPSSTQNNSRCVEKEKEVADKNRLLVAQYNKLSALLSAYYNFWPHLYIFTYVITYDDISNSFKHSVIDIYYFGNTCYWLFIKTDKIVN